MFNNTVVQTVVISVCVALAAGTGWASEKNAGSKFSELKGEYNKKEYLKNLASSSKQEMTSEASEDASKQEPVMEVFKTALSEVSPVVVEQAVIGIGKLNYTPLASELIPLYRNAPKRFVGYGERIRIAIIGAFGVMDGNAGSADFLGELLNKDNGTILGQKILDAIKELHNEQLTEVVTKYAEKMELRIETGKKRGDDPMLYSNARQNAAVARDVLSSLTTR